MPQSPATGVRAVHRLIDEEHVPVLLGALATPVTHAIMSIVQDAKIPLVIDISGGQDFVDASGVGGNPYVFKTIPSNLDIARGMVGWLKPQGAHTVAIVADDAPLNRVNAASLAKAAQEAGLDVAADETLPKGTTDLAPMMAHLKALAPDHPRHRARDVDSAFLPRIRAVRLGCAGGRPDRSRRRDGRRVARLRRPRRLGQARQHRRVHPHSGQGTGQGFRGLIPRPVTA